MSQSRQQIWIVSGIALIVVVTVAAIVISNSITSLLAETKTEEQFTVNVSEDGGIQIGDPIAPVIVVQFLDYACYQCANYQPTILALTDQFVVPDLARLEIRILAGLDPVGSAAAARSALCAAEQSAFFQMHNLLLDMQLQYRHSAFIKTRLQSAAAQIGLDMEEFNRCINNETTYNQLLQDNAQLTARLQVSNLPTLLLRTRASQSPFWIEQAGRQLTGPIPLDILGAAINQYQSAE